MVDLAITRENGTTLASDGLADRKLKTRRSIRTKTRATTWNTATEN